MATTEPRFPDAAEPATASRELRNNAAAKARVRSVEELDSAIARLSQHLNTTTYRLLLLVREFDDRLGWAKWSFLSCAEWLAWRCGLSLSAAREKVRTAHALRGLPAISRACADGRLSYTKVRALTRVANAQNEDLLLAFALDATAPQVEERCRQLRNSATDSVDVARRAWERRSLRILRNDAAGTMTITLELPIEDGEVFAGAIDRAVEEGKAQLGPEFEANGWRAQQADAAVEVAKAFLGRGFPAAGASAAADHYQVVVHVDEAALRGGVGRADLPVETIRRLTCDGSVVQLAEDAKGVPLDIGRKTRTVPAAIRRALRARDRSCRFPGCEHRHYVDAHHIEHWAHGGATSLDNLILLCTQHHRLLHEAGFTIKHDEDGTVRFARGDGRVIPRCGYRAADVVDSDEDIIESIDGLIARVAGSPGPSTEVREPHGRYDIAVFSIAAERDEFLGRPKSRIYVTKMPGGAQRTTRQGRGIIAARGTR